MRGERFECETPRRFLTCASLYRMYLGIPPPVLEAASGRLTHAGLRVERSEHSRMMLDERRAGAPNREMRRIYAMVAKLN